jgi:RNA recognition motif-containing protein
MCENPTYKKFLVRLARDYRANRSGQSPFLSILHASLAGYYGVVVDVRLSVDDVVGLPRGTALVEYETAEDADEACVRLNGGLIDGGILVVSLAHGEVPCGRRVDTNADSRDQRRRSRSR